MPAYNATPPQILSNSIPITLWNNEVVAVGALSQQVALEPLASWTGFAAVEVLFSGNPGTFEIDLMSATTDQAKFYCQRSSMAVVNGQFVGRIEVGGIIAKFLALQLKSLQNPGVTITANII